MAFLRRLIAAIVFAGPCVAVTVATPSFAQETATIVSEATTETTTETATTETVTTETVTTETVTTETVTTETVTTEEPLSLPPFQGPQYRYPHTTLFPRIGLDIIAIPASVVGWDEADWAGFTAVMAPVVVLMLPFNPSLDVEFQRWINANKGGDPTPFLYKVKTPAMSIFTVAYMGAFWGTAWISQDDTVLELVSLTSEALVVGQFYHLSLKVLIGREGPYQGTKLGIVHGPTFEWFPGGTPSGHLVTVSVLASVWGEYFDSWILRGAGLAVTGYMAAASVYGNAHFLSDVIWGAGMGYAVTSWVVRNRSTRYRYTDEGREWVGVVPLALPDVAGVQVVGGW